MAAQLSSSCLISTNHKLPTYTHPALMGSTSADNTNISQAQLFANHSLNHMANHTTNQANDHSNNLNDSCSLESAQQEEQSINDSSFNIINNNESNSNLPHDHFYHGDTYYTGVNYNTNLGGQGVKCPSSLLTVDEYESKSSSDNPDECEHELPADGRPTKKRYHRHSQHQIQEMERVFKECPHPDEKQRLELSRELKLDPRQVKFWFQNKRTQVKAQHERHDNSYLRTENEKLRAENLALRDAIANVTCPSCGGPAALSDVSFDDQQLRIENVRLREEIDRISKIAAKHVGRPISTLNLGSSALASPTSTTNSTLYLSTENQGGNNTNNNSTSLVENDTSNQSQLVLNHKPIRLTEAEKPMVMELAMGALEELTQVAQAGEPLWLVDPLTGLETLDAHLYLQRFPPHHLLHTPAPLSSNFRRESTRHSCLVLMDSSSVVDILMNASAWSEMFSCIVSTAVPIEVIASGTTTNSQDGAMQIIYAEFQLPTPVVSTRESYFIRYAKRMSSHQAMWVVVDVSVDNLLRANSMSAPLVRCRRHPSGCIIEELPNGYSKVTWVEHSEIDEQKGVHRLYEQLVRSGMAFGAQRWLATLHRQCESIHTASNINVASPTKDLVSPTIEGRRSILKLAERMTNSFCGGVSASVAHTWITLSTGSSTGPGTSNEMASHHMGFGHKGLGMPSIGGGGSNDVVPPMAEDVRVLVRKSVDDPGRPPGVVLCAATSIWLPVPPSRVFKFLQDQSFRNEWDILSNMGAVEEIMRVPKSHDNSNSVSLLRVNAASSNQPNMLILQECWADETSYVVVYAPVDIAAMSSVINGGDPECVALLPSGFSIFPDGPPHHHMITNPTPNLSIPTGTPVPSPGSLLNVAFQILVDHVPTAKLSLGSVATVNNLISSTVLRIRNALACDNACIS